MLDLEKFKFTDGKTNLSAEEFNARFYALVRRIHTLEQVRMDWEGAITEIQNAGVARIDGAVQPLVEDLQEVFESQQSGWQALMAEAEPQVQNWGQEHNSDGTHGDVSLANSADFMTEHQADGRHKAADFDLSGSAHFRTSHNADGSMFLPGFLHGLKLAVNGTNEITIDPGCLDLSGKVYRLEAQTTKNMTGLAANSNYHIYAGSPSSGLVLSGDEFWVTPTVPTYDPARGAGYQGDGRWLGWFRTNDSQYISTIESVHQFNAVPVGGLILSSGCEDEPFGFIFPDGSSLSKTTYADLHNGHPHSIGDIYGNADPDHFNLPNYVGIIPRFWPGSCVDHDPDYAARTDRGDGETADKLGTYQANQNKAHTHAQIGRYSFETTHYHASGGGGAAEAPNPDGASASGMGNTASSGGSQSNPNNKTVAILVKYIDRL